MKVGVVNNAINLWFLNHLKPSEKELKPKPLNLDLAVAGIVTSLTHAPGATSSPINFLGCSSHVFPASYTVADDEDCDDYDDHDDDG